MATTRINLDRQAEGKTFALGTTAASGQGLLTLNNGTAAVTNVVLDVKGSTSIAGDLNLTGNLNITGSIDEQSVTNLAVKDLTVTTNKGGTTAGAAGAGLKVEGDSATTIAALTYNASSPTKWQVGNGTTQVDIVDASTAQVITNKSISGGQITSAVANATSATNITGTLAVSQGGTGATSTTGSGANVLATSPTLVTPTLGAATATSINKVAVTAPATGATLALADGSTLATVGGFSTTLTATAATNVTLPTTGTLVTTTGSISGTAGNVTGTVAVGNGGTGATTLTGYVKGTGTTAMTASATIPGADISGNISGNAANVTGTVAIANGGTGATTQATAANAILPSQTSANGLYLKSDGTNVSWAAVSAPATFKRTTITITQNGSNTTATLGNTPTANSEQIILNGQILNPGSGNDYTITGATVTFATAPQASDVLQAFALY